MTIDEATTILRAAGAIDGRSLYASGPPVYPPTMIWVEGEPDVYLHGRFTPELLEAVGVWMRAHDQEA